MSTIQDPRKNWLATGSLLTIWWRVQVPGAKIGAALCLPALAVAVSCLLLCLWPGEGPVCSWLALLWYLLSSLSRPGFELEPFKGKFSLSISSLRLFSGHSGSVLTLRTDNASHASLSSPRLLVVDVSFWATSPLAVAVRCIFCVFCLFLFSSWLCCSLRVQNSPQTYL